MSADMTIEEARRVIRDDNQRLSRQVRAATVLCGSPESSLEVLLACLKHPDRMVSRPAATELHRRTGRPEKDDQTEFLVVDYQDWCDYLRDRQNWVDRSNPETIGLSSSSLHPQGK
jgi:hypothetical protein